jgi:putative membrane protein
MSPGLLKFLERWLINTLAVLVAVEVLPGVGCEKPRDLFAASLLLGILNAFLKPILMLIALPLVISTLGLFVIVINAALLLLTSSLVPSFRVDGFWWAVAGAVIISLVSLAVNHLTGGNRSNLEMRWRRAPGRPRSDQRPPDAGGGPVIDV